MITMMPASINSPRTYSLIIQGIKNVVNLLLMVGAHSKPKLEIQEQNNEYKIENKRTIKIDHDFSYFKKLLDDINPKKIRPIDKKFENDSNQYSRNVSEEEKFKRENKSSDYGQIPLISKKVPDESLKMTERDREFSWVVKTDKIPSGEALLKLFGKILFDSAGSTGSLFEEARLLSINILCKIFTKATAPFPEAAVKRFYKVYLDYLESELSWPHFQILLKHSTELFLVNHLPHNIILQKPLINKLLEYYSKTREINPQDKILRRASSKICSSLLCFINGEYGLINEVKSYERNVKDILYELLESAFQKDKDIFFSQKPNVNKGSKEEIKILARSSWNFMMHSILNFKIFHFVSKISDVWFEKNVPLLNNLGIDILLVLGEMCLMRLDEFESPCQMTHDIFLAATNILEKIRKFIEQRTKDLNDIVKLQPPKNNEKTDLIKQLSVSFGVLYTWLLIIIHLKEVENLDSKTEFPFVFKEVIKLLVAYQNNDLFTISIKSMLAALFTRLGNLSFSRNSSFTSSVLLNDKTKFKTLEECICIFLILNNLKVAEKLEEKCLLSIAIGEDTILSFYDLEIESRNETLVFMVRNVVGKFYWFGELFYKLFCPSSDENGETIRIPEAGKLSNLKEEDNKLKNQSSEIISNQSSPSVNQEIEILLQQQFEMEDQYEKTHHKTMQNRKLSFEHHSNASRELNGDEKAIRKKNIIKMFLSNTGLLNLKNLDKVLFKSTFDLIYSKLTYIPFGEPAKDLLKKIDSTPARCQISASIFYVLMPSSDRLDEFPRFDNLFQKFIEELGIVIDENTLEMGAHESIKTYVNQYKKVIFASNPLYEIIFTMPNLLHAQTTLQEFSSIPPIIIIWNAKVFTPYESFYPYIINRLDLKGYKKTALIITPLNESYFCLNLLKKDSDFVSFPPVNDFICSNHMLANTVLQIIISIHREYMFCQHQLLYHEIIVGKMMDRQKHISNLISFCRKDDHLWELFKAFFDASKSQNS